MDLNDSREVLEDRKGYFYAVLNLTEDATRAEINERYRSLSLIFHPDKQQSEELKASATKEFLVIQKAYQVLSDPFLRQVYDVLGPPGLKVQWPSGLARRSKKEIQDILKQQGILLDQQKSSQLLMSRSRLGGTLDVSPLLSPSFLDPASRALSKRVRRVKLISRNFAYAAEKRVNPSTSVGFEGRSSMQGPDASMRLLGTVRHQFSPRLSSLALVDLGPPYLADLEFIYNDGENHGEIKGTFLPTLLLNTIPVVSVSYSRKLFRHSLQRGKISLHISPNPSLGLYYISPPFLKLGKEGAGSLENSAPSIRGLKYIAFERSTGLVFNGLLPQLIMESGIRLLELSTRIKASLQYGLNGLSASFGIDWNNDTTEAGSTLVVGAMAVVLELHFSYHENRVALPIVLSTQFSPRLVLGALVFPSSMLVLGYHFWVVPRRRARRLAHLRTAKRDFEEDADSRTKRNAVESLLKDTVRKQVRIETERQGLIIQHATYGAVETEDINESLLLDVTMPLQALVRNSQLHIPGGDTKAALQGFADPAPFIPKSLRIGYMFRGRVHYAEIPDYLPVVLPLAEHLDGFGDR